MDRILPLKRCRDLDLTKDIPECVFTLGQAEKANRAWNKFLEEPGAIVTGPSRE